MFRKKSAYKFQGIPNVLSIAGSDPSGGAGIQADIKTISALGGYAMAVPTALTVQNTMGVSDIHYPPAQFVADQLSAVFEDIRVDAVKIGMAGAADTVELIARILDTYRPPYIVLDPVMVAQSGDDLSTQDSVEAMLEYLWPLATLVTPNIPEAERILGRPFDGDYEGFAQDVLDKTDAQRVYFKGGHADDGRENEIIDIYMDPKTTVEFFQDRIETSNTHGTGCTLSSALATFLAYDLNYEEAAHEAKAYITEALSHADKLDVGHGAGPVNHFFDESK